MRIISGSCLIHPAETSTTPPSATAAAKRCSNAIARGTQYPAWLTPISATWSSSTSGRGEDRVEDRGQDGFPVVAERDVLLIQRRLLPGTVERHPVVAAFGRGRSALQPHRRGGAVAAVVHHHQRSLLSGRGIRRAEEETLERRVLVRDRDALPGDRLEIDDPLPAGPLAAPQLELTLGRVVGRAGEPVERGRVVGRRAPVVGERADAAPGRLGFVAGGLARLSRGGPFVNPRISVAVSDPIGGGERLAHIGRLTVRGAERDLETKLELGIRKWLFHVIPFVSGRVPLFGAARQLAV